MNLSVLKYPKKSHRKFIIFPGESEKLAEAMGIIFGDGGIGNLWQLAVSLNSQKDQIYASYIISLFQDLFAITPFVWRRRNENTLVIKYSSMNLVDFLVEKGAVREIKLLKQLIFLVGFLLMRVIRESLCVDLSIRMGVYIFISILLEENYMLILASALRVFQRS